MFAAAKTGSSFGVVLREVLWIGLEKGFRKTFLKKDIKSIVGEKKGFYICTRLRRKDFKRR